MVLSGWVPSSWISPRGAAEAEESVSMAERKREVRSRVHSVFMRFLTSVKLTFSKKVWRAAPSSMLSTDTTKPKVAAETKVTRSPWLHSPYRQGQHPKYDQLGVRGGTISSHPFQVDGKPWQSRIRNPHPCQFSSTLVSSRKVFASAHSVHRMPCQWRLLGINKCKTPAKQRLDVVVALCLREALAPHYLLQVSVSYNGAWGMAASGSFDILQA